MTDMSTLTTVVAACAAQHHCWQQTCLAGRLPFPTRLKACLPRASSKPSQGRGINCMEGDARLQVIRAARAGGHLLLYGSQLLG